MSVLLVAGHHRSGTSLFAQLLNRAGLFLGTDLIGASDSNPYGHFEDREFVRVHDALLREQGETWMVTEPFVPYIGLHRWEEMQTLVQRRHSMHRMWGFKDPRVCWYLSAWKYLIPDMKVAVIYRDASETIYSLERRHATELFRGVGPPEKHRLFWEIPDHALRLWLASNEALVGFAEGHAEDVLVFSFEDLRTGMPVVQAINAVWGLGLKEVPNEEVFDRSVTQARSSRQPVARSQTAQRVLQVWDDLERLSDVTYRRLQGILHAT